MRAFANILAVANILAIQMVQRKPLSHGLLPSMPGPHSHITVLAGAAAEPIPSRLRLIAISPNLSSISRT